PIFLENQDHVWGLALIINGLFIAYFAVRGFGVERFRAKLINTKWNDIRIGIWWEYIMKYIIPLQFVVLLLWFSFDTLTQEPSSWWRGGPLGLSLMVLEWGAVLFILYYYNSWIARRFRRGGVREKGAVDAIVVER
ncbi:MAG: hypothetical protein JSW07_04435, partial [bacterium]